MGAKTKKNWKRVGKLEHCAPESKFHFKGETFDGKNLTEAHLVTLKKRGYAMVREATGVKPEPPKAVDEKPADGNGLEPESNATPTTPKKPK